VAEWYRNNLAPRGTIEIDRDGQRVRLDPQGFERGFNEAAQLLDKHKANAKAAISELEKEINTYTDIYDRPPSESHWYHEAISYLRGWAERNPRWVGRAGRIYEVELAPKVEDYLDWDKPLLGQSPEVRFALAKMQSDLPASVVASFRGKG